METPELDAEATIARRLYNVDQAKCVDNLHSFIGNLEIAQETLNQDLFSRQRRYVADEAEELDIELNSLWERAKDLLVMMENSNKE